MYLPRNLLSLLYTNLQRTRHSYSAPVLLLVSLEPDALCACRILIKLFKRDSISYNITPVAGYGDLAQAAQKHIHPMRVQNGGSGGTVVCLGVGGLIDLAEAFELDTADNKESVDVTGGVEFWVIDARRPWNLGNVFGGAPPEIGAIDEMNGNARTKRLGVEFGEIKPYYKPGRGGIIVFDDGDISEELETQREAYFKLEQMPEIEDDGRESDYSESETEDEGSETSSPNRKRKRGMSVEDGESEEDVDRPRRRQRSNSQDSDSSAEIRPGRRGLISSSTVPNSHPSRSPSPSDLLPSGQAKPVSARRNRRRLLRLKRKHEATLQSYYSLGVTYSEPISSILYSLASVLGREDNDSLWDAVVGVSSMELYGRTITGLIPPPSESNPYIGWGGDRGERIRQVLRDEVRRLNPPNVNDFGKEASHGEALGVIPTTASSPTDCSIRLSPEPAFLLIRHWSLYDSMLHSPYLASRLHLWTDTGRKRLDKLLAKMGMKLEEVKQNYTHMDMNLKKILRRQLLKNAPLYGLQGLIPPEHANGQTHQGWGFVKSWGWKACLSALDVGVIVGAILEVGKSDLKMPDVDAGTHNNNPIDATGKIEGEEYIRRFYEAYDALEEVSKLLGALPRTMHLHRAILRTGSTILTKEKIQHLRAFRVALVRDGPDVQLFTHPGALTKLALWVSEALIERERDRGKKPTPLVLAALNEMRGVYIVVGTGGKGSGFGIREKELEERKKEQERKREQKKAEKEKKREEKRAAKATKKEAREEDRGDDDDDEEDETEEEGSEDDDDDDDDEGSLDPSRNRFGNSFQEVVDETNARVRMESFDHCVVEVKKDDLGPFLESLSSKNVVS